MSIIPFALSLPVHMTGRQLAILAVLCTEQGPHTIRGLAARLSLSKPVVVRAINTLEADELVARLDDPHDGRSVNIEVLPAGHDLFIRLTTPARPTALAA